MAEKVFFDNKREKTLAGILNNGRPNSPLLVFVHGFAGNKDENGLFVEAEKYFSERSYNTFRFDVEGAGESKGDFKETSMEKQADDLESALDYVTRTYPINELGVVGFSLGATLALMKPNPKAKVYVFWSPAFFTAKDMFPRYSSQEVKKEMLQYGCVVKAGLLVGSEIIEDFKKYNPEEYMRKLQKPVLLIHGTADPRIDYRNTISANHYFSDSELILIPKANHSYKENPTHRKMLFDGTYNWLRKHFDR